MRQDTFTVKDIHCQSCEWTIRTLVGDHDGASDVSPHRQTNQVTISYDETIVDEALIPEALASAGYPVT